MHRYEMIMIIDLEIVLAHLEWRLWCLSWGGEDDEVHDAASVDTAARQLINFEYFAAELGKILDITPRT